MNNPGKFTRLGLLLLLTSMWQPCEAQENPNALAVGKYAKVRTPVTIEVNPVAELNWKTRAEVLEMRRKEIQKHPQLLLTPYVPYPPIWSAVEDKRPWWGTAGSALWGAGDRSIEGPAEESRFILNPFMLVGANPGTLNMWQTSLIKKEQIDSPDFPYFWYPSSIRFDAAKGFATAVFPMRKYVQQIRSVGALKHPDITPNQFSLVAYNARDFGYNYIWLNEARSVNVTNDNRYTEPTSIRQMLHCGGTCKYTGGCNNMSPFMKEIDRCRFTALPARVCVYLWKKEPATVEAEPDFIFLLDFI